MKNKRNPRFYLQIQLKSTSFSLASSKWDINEPFDTYIECFNYSKGLIDDTVNTARIVDKAFNKVVNKLK